MKQGVVNDLKKIYAKRGGEIEENADLAGLSSIRVGGKARILCSPSTEECLEESLKCLRDAGEKYFIAGNCSNVLFPDHCFDRAVIKLPGGDFSWEQKGRELTVSSGLRLSCVLRKCSDRGILGLECMSGIPATIGGAIRNNASSTEGAITDTLTRIQVLDDSMKKIWIEKQDLRFGYRSFSWPGGGVILKAVFSLSVSSKEEVRGRIKKVFLDKWEKQPCDKRTLGCVFKNPGKGGQTAWRLVDGAGMRGKRRGGAVVSEKHANFIINDNRATSFDVRGLISDIKTRVMDKFGIELEEEIEIVES